MRPIVFLVKSLLIIIASPNESHARLIGFGGWSSNKVTTPILKENIADGAATVSNNDSDIKIQQHEPAANKPIVTGTHIFATLFDVGNEENLDDACYECCCDRNVVCNSPHVKTEAACRKNACDNGATCQSKGYICPSYNCEEEMLW